MNDKRVYDDITQAVGQTPLVRLNRVVEGFEGEAFAKIEFMNPMGSVKDRIARYMIEKARQEEKLKQGDTIVEASSGNTAMGLAMMAIVCQYRCKVVVRDRTSKEKIDSLRALGVDVQIVDATLPPEDPVSYNRIMERVVAETPDSYFPDQHNNRENNEAHYHTTGPEIWDQMDGRIDYFVAGIGTGGTVCGVGRYLKEKDPKVQVVAVDPVGSIFSEYFHHRTVGKPGQYLIEGLGDETLIGCVEWELIDDMIQVADRDAFLCARELACKEAILAGGSSGAALWGIREVLRRASRPVRVVTLFPDGGVRYLTKIYNDEWMSRHGFL